MAELVYEMVWDCRYCAAKKLLGLTHRHCPNCGAQQDPNARYFPADNEKVAVQNHEYVGADVQCRYCGGPSSKRAHNCGQCGAPLAEGVEVQARMAELPAAQLWAPGVSSAAPPRALWKVIVPIVALFVVAVTVLLLVWKKEQAFVVAAHSWRRSVSVERLGPAHDAEGAAATPAPHWPAVALGRAACSSAGCEREGARDESYTVVFRDKKGESYRCELAEPAWSGFTDGQRYSGKLRALVGSLDCGSLVAVR